MLFRSSGHVFHFCLAKFAKYVAGQKCANCTFYQGKPTDAWAACPLFANKQVAAKGWCSAYVKKA